MSKFKGGDKVKCINRYYGNETLGKVYTVHPDKHYESGRFYVEKDDFGNKNSYKYSDFELVKEKNNMIKVGDRVKVIDDLASHGSFDDCNIVDAMHKYAGKTLTVSGIVETRSNRYRLKDDKYDDIGWSFTKEMLEVIKPIFKKGDLVRALSTSAGGGYIKGRTYRVKYDCFNANEHTSVSTEVDSNGSTTNGWANKFFELVKEDDEIETLIEAVNKGYQALVTLYNDYEGKFEHYSGDSLIVHYNYNSLNKIVRKQKEFKQFKTRDGDLISVKCDVITIGCQSFDIKEFTKVLKLLANEKSIVEKIKGSEAQATRSGISYNGYTLSWEDADKLLEALKEYTA